MPNNTPMPDKRREGPHGPAILLRPFSKDEFPTTGKKVLQVGQDDPPVDEFPTTGKKEESENVLYKDRQSENFD